MLRRHTWMKRTALAPGGRLPAVNRERAAKRNAENFGTRAVAVRAMPCLCSRPRHLGSGCSGRIEAAHVRSRGAGGNRRHLIPLCLAHHREQHDHGIKTFADKYSLDLHAEAERIAAQLDEQGHE